MRKTLSKRRNMLPFDSETKSMHVPEKSNTLDPGNTSDTDHSILEIIINFYHSLKTFLLSGKMPEPPC